jgi:hypothetical protein
VRVSGVQNVTTLLIALLTAFGGGAGIAAIIKELRDGRKSRVAEAVTVPKTGEARESTYRLTDGASWSVGLGVVALLLALALVVATGVTTGPARALKWAAVGFAGLAIAVGFVTWIRYRARPSAAELATLRMSTGFLAAGGALLAILIAG